MFIRTIWRLALLEILFALCISVENIVAVLWCEVTLPMDSFVKSVFSRRGLSDQPSVEDSNPSAKGAKRMPQPNTTRWLHVGAGDIIFNLAPLL
jgi:hypothetical protein